MKCPKFVAAAIASNRAQNDSVLDCIEEECALWFKETDRCAMLELAGATCAVAEHLSVLRDKAEEVTKR